MGQLYGKEQVGKTKVEALHSVVTSLCGENKLTTCFEEVKPSEGNWLDYVNFSAVVCTTFDSIKARKIVYERWKDYGVLLVTDLPLILETYLATFGLVRLNLIPTFSNSVCSCFIK